MTATATIAATAAATERVGDAAATAAPARTGKTRAIVKKVGGGTMQG
jgi:hypothetical protein